MSAPIKQRKKCQFNAYMNSKYLPFYLSLTMATAIYHHFTYDRNIYIYSLYSVELELMEVVPNFSSRTSHAHGVMGLL